MHIVCMNHSLNAHSASLAKYEERFVHLHFLFLNVHTVSEKQPDPDLGGEGKRGQSVLVRSADVAPAQVKCAAVTGLNGQGVHLRRTR